MNAQKIASYTDTLTPSLSPSLRVLRVLRRFQNTLTTLTHSIGVRGGEGEPGVMRVGNAQFFARKDWKTGARKTLQIGLEMANLQQIAA